jgi:hypothetical protein
MRHASRAALPLLTVLAACGSPERGRLERGMAFARRLFEEAGRNPLAAASLGGALEMGGNLSSYLYAGMPENADLPRFRDGRPDGPWTIALRAGRGDTIIIEGFGESLERPVLAETVLVRPLSPE